MTGCKISKKKNTKYNKTMYFQYTYLHIMNTDCGEI